MSEELALYQGQLHWMTFGEVTECKSGMPHVQNMVAQHQSADRLTPTGSNPLQCFLFLNDLFY